jgi:hypothetical protein
LFGEILKGRERQGVVAAQQGGLTHLGSHGEAVGMPQRDYVLGVRMHGTDR